MSNSSDSEPKEPKGKEGKAKNNDVVVVVGGGSGGSGNGNGGSGSGSGSGSGGSVEDEKFLAEMLKCCEGNVVVDYEKMATTLGFKNLRSITNRFSTLKNKYNLNLTTSAKKISTNTKSGGGDAEIEKPSTPIKVKANRVTKPRTPAKKTGTTPKKPVGKKVKKEVVEDNVKDQDEEMEDEDEFVKVAVTSPEVDAKGNLFPNL